MLYASLIGTQVMSVLNPLMGLIDQKKRPQQVYLLPTSETLRRAEAIQGFLERRHGFQKADLIIEQISDSLSQDNKGHLPAHEMLSHISSGNAEIALNVSGGLNFQVAAALLSADPDRFLFLYPESACIHAIHIQTGKLKHSTWPLPKPADVLSLQEVPHDDYQVTIPPLFQRLLTDCKINLPDSLKSVMVGNVYFDLVWNMGNVMRFVRVIQSSKLDGKKPKDYKMEARDIISLAVGKEQFGELYHRSICVVTNHATVAERLRAEASGKVHTVFYYDGMPHDERKKAYRDFASFMAPSETGLGTVQGSLEVFETGRKNQGSGALYVPLGRDPLPTMIAIWTHQPKELHLLYTPGDPRVETVAKAFRNERKLIPAEVVTCWPVDIVGTGILKTLPQPTASGSGANITPGTKGQTSFLSLWAKANGVPIFSIRTQTAEAVEIPDGRKISAKAPEPLDYLRLAGANLASPGEDPRAFSNGYRSMCEGVLQMFSDLKDAGGSLRSFPFKSFNYKTISFSREGDQANISVKRGNYSFNMEKGGFWFEKVVGFAALKAGADDVRVGVKTAWSSTTEAFLMSKHSSGPDTESDKQFMTDIDVVVKKGINYYAISCKATEARELEQTTDEAVAFASVLSRFVVPMVCFLRYDGEPYKERNDVVVFGWKSLASSRLMEALLNVAVNLRRKAGKA